MPTLERPRAPYPNAFDQGEIVEIMVMRYGPGRVPQLAEVKDGHYIPAEKHFPRGGWWYTLKYRAPSGKPMSISRHEGDIRPATGPHAGETPKAREEIPMYRKKALSDPNSCFNRARPDERLFVLLGRDKAAPAAIRAWASERIRIGKNTAEDAQITEALAIADEMERAG